MYHAIVFLPLVGFLIAGLFGRVIGPRPSELVTTASSPSRRSCPGSPSVRSASARAPTRVQVATWFVSGDLAVDWAFRIDTLTAVMLVVVTTVSALVHLYSIGYMHEDPHRPRFFAYLSLFTFAMLMLVTADNLVQMFFGWEGVGLASYLLIGFWYEKPSANAAAMKAFIVNRVGDFGFALGIFLVFVLYGSVSFEQILPRVGRAEGRRRSTSSGTTGTRSRSRACSCSWARWASRRSSCCTPGCPTPWRARRPSRRSSTRRRWSRPACSWSRGCRRSSSCRPTALTVVTVIGAITAFFAATVGLVQNDIKRVIAYSTCSQLGYMFVALGVGAYGAGMFHLFTHAFFKALLFLGAGSVIHAMHHEQDMRNMGGAAPPYPAHGGHDGDRHARADRLPVHGRLLLEGRHHRGGLRVATAWPRLRLPGDGRRRAA